jgi:hypothetical protein
VTASPAQPELPPVSDCRQVRLTPGRRLRTRVAGVFLFLPLLARLRLDQLVRQAGYPGSRMVPAVSALLSLLALKLLDKERRSHIADFNFDEALGLFAGLNVLPKKSVATDYSYRTQRCQQRQLLASWVAALAPLLFPQGDTFSLDFHPIPYRGDPAGLDTHFVSTRGKACPSVLSFFAQEYDSRVLCYANADLTRSTQAQEVMRFVEFWHEVSGQDPHWLYFDSKVAPYTELNRVNQRGIRFITIRRRGASVLRRLHGLPASAWQRAVLNIPKRRHQQIRFVDETIRLRDYAANIRQVAVTGLGRKQPTLLLSNDFDETARSLVVRYAGRNRVEDGLGQSVNFFHLDCLSSEVQLNVDLDAALTVLANGCYRWLGRQLQSFDKAAAKQLYRKFVETAGVVEIQPEQLVVHFDKRAHNPLLRAAALGSSDHPVPWLHHRPVVFEFP